MGPSKELFAGIVVSHGSCRIALVCGFLSALFWCAGYAAAGGVARCFVGDVFRLGQERAVWWFADSGCRRRETGEKMVW